MAVYDKGRNQLNDMERSSGGATKRLDMGTVESGLVADDIVVIGALPRESLTTDIRILVQEAFNGGGFVLGFYDYPSGGFVDIATIVAGAIDEAGKLIVVDLPTNGLITAADALYTGDRGSIWNGKSESILAIKWTGSTPTTGAVDIVTAHTYFGTKDGQYGLAYVPMKPSKN